MELDTWTPHFKKYFSMIISAPRWSGKSYLLKHLLNEYLIKDYDLICVMTNQHGIDYYGEFIPGELLFVGFHEDVITKIKEIQHSLIRKGGKMLDILIIFDDVIGGTGKKNVRNADAITQIFANGRHDNISIIFIIQDITFLNTKNRGNCDLFVSFYEKSNRAKEFVIDSYMSGLIDEDDLGKVSEKTFLKKIMRNTCQNYQCIVIDYLNQNSNNFKEIIYKYKAP